MSFGLAGVTHYVMPLEGYSCEALEGATILIAAGVLYTASFWLISKSDAHR